MYTEAGNQFDDLEGKMKKVQWLNEDEEIEKEQKERKLWKRLNEWFSQFSKDIEDLSQKSGIDFKFDIPYTELGF